MKIHLKFLLKAFIFLLVLGTVLTIFFQVITPKFLYSNSNWPTTSTFVGFYQMQEDSIDVLFLGSSHAASAFIPQELYNNYGIKSYNLSSEQQNLVVSYYWLKEALRFQEPKVVVLDCYLVFPFFPNNPLNTDENFTRKSFDFMKWSSVKKEAVETVCYYDESQSLVSYYLPNIRYHDRWAELTSDDFLLIDMAEHCELKGYAPLYSRRGTSDNFSFSEDTAVEGVPMFPLMQDYLEKICVLCEENDITLILVETPTSYVEADKYNTLSVYAKDHGIPYIDFNLNSMYQETDYDISFDNCDDVHANLWGAQKITNYVGRLIQERYLPESAYDMQWEDTKVYYENIITEHE